jgi:perosamine synthetase
MLPVRTTGGTAKSRDKNQDNMIRRDFALDHSILLRLYWAMTISNPAATTVPPSRPLVPLGPVLSRASFARDSARTASVLDAGAVRFVTSGRIAIALALREMKIGPGDTVLVPAYHSLSMVPPVQWCGATPRFYKVGPDTAVDLDDVAAKLDGSVKAVMVTNYFGFPQDLARIRAFCDSHGLLMLEDCAHCFFGQRDGKPVGSYGDYAIASSMKFFPNYEGGCLVSSRHSLAPVALRSAGAGFELKVALSALENSFAYGRLAAVEAMLRLPLRLKTALWSRLKARRSARPRSAGPALAPASSDSSFDFDPAWLDKRSSWFSRRLVTRPGHGRIVALRRANYLRLEQALGALAGCRPLFACLPEGACPWLFPLLVEQPEAVFGRLLAAGVPVTRFAETLWPGVDAGVCANSAALSRQVLAFPCHQELRAQELDWLIAQVAKALLP